VKSLFNSKDLSEPMRRRVELAVAVAHERLLATHVDHALKLIQLVGVRVPFRTVLGIYTRLLRLNEDEARVITTRTLATLGERADDNEEAWAAEKAAEEVVEEKNGPRRGFIGNLRQRLRGRVNDELRQWIEFAAARTEVALLETHVDNSLQFVELLDGELGVDESVELYLDAVDVRESIGEVVYYLTLARLSDRFLPTVPPQVSAGGASAGDAPVDRRLRVIEQEGA
jgi:hypothetical protein